MISSWILCSSSFSPVSLADLLWEMREYKYLILQISVSGTSLWNTDVKTSFTFCSLKFLDWAPERFFSSRTFLPVVDRMSFWRNLAITWTSYEALCFNPSKNFMYLLNRARFSWLQGYYVTGLIKGKGVLTD